MFCPSCQTRDRERELHPVLTRKGVEIELCRSCRGVWLDRGEIFLLSDHPEATTHNLNTALGERNPSERLSPKTGDPMEAIIYPGGFEIEHCPTTGGLWFDAREYTDLIRHDKYFKLDFDPKTIEFDRPLEPPLPEEPPPQTDDVQEKLQESSAETSPEIIVEETADPPIAATSDIASEEPQGQLQEESPVDTPEETQEEVPQESQEDSSEKAPESSKENIREPSREGPWGAPKEPVEEGKTRQKGPWDFPEERIETVKPENRMSSPAVAAGALLLPLPDLFIRSLVTIIGLYGFATLVLLIVSVFLGFPASVAFGLAIFVTAIQFASGPYVMDMTLGWMYRMDWLPKNEIPDAMHNFIARVCEEKNMSFPRVGIIDDGAPQAFTYGHSPNNARIVISRGLLELLDEDEANAVIAHEIGHAVHWDMFLMTVVQAVPLIFYHLYRTSIRVQKTPKSDKGDQLSLVVAIGAFLLYLISQYVVLWFSRAREYHADRFAGEVTGDPSLLASALAKIAYGLAGQEKSEKDIKAVAEDGSVEGRSPKMEAIGALGIFDTRTATSMAIAGYAGPSTDGAVDPESLKSAMRWDLWNPWAKWFELNSTHPLIAERLLHLSNQSIHMGRKPYVVFNEQQPESYWDEFYHDFAIYIAPFAALVLTPLMVAIAEGFSGFSPMMVGVTMTTCGIALFVKNKFSYPEEFFPEVSIAALLRKVKASAVRPVPCIVRGTVIGRGVPGYIFSEDFVMRDDTGIMFLDYRQPIAIWEAMYGLLKAGGYTGKDVVIEGWYRRAPMPYIEINKITSEGAVSKSYVPKARRVTSIVLIVLGLLITGAVVSA